MGQLHLLQPNDKKNYKFFKSVNTQIPFCTNNTIRDILKTLTNNTNTYMRNDIYQLQCHTCHNYYLGQAGCF